MIKYEEKLKMIYVGKQRKKTLFLMIKQNPNQK